MHLNLLMVCDMNDNWVILLFTSCMWLILKYLLVGCMGTWEACPSHFQHIQSYIVLKRVYTLLLYEGTRNLYPSKYSSLDMVMLHMLC